MSNNNNRNFLGDYQNPAFDHFKMVVKLKGVNSTNPKAPVLRGILVATPAKLKAMLETLEQQNKQVVYIDVALWDARDGGYKYEGTTSLRETFDSAPTTVEERMDTLRTEVPESIYRI